MAESINATGWAIPVVVAMAGLWASVRLGEWQDARKRRKLNRRWPNGRL